MIEVRTEPVALGPASTLLPREARDMLISASRVKNPHDRLVAIDAAIDYVKLRFPWFFKPQPERE